MEERVRRFQAFYRRENDRPLFGFTLGSECPMPRYHASNSLPEDRPLQPEDFVASQYMPDCQRMFQKQEECGGDFIWSGSIFWGIPWLEAALGCPIYANHTTGSIYSKPVSDLQAILSAPRLTPDPRWVAKAKEFLSELRKASNGQWPIGTTRMRGISDLLSALYGDAEFIYAMIDEPETVAQLCEKLTDYWIDFARLQFDHMDLFYGGMGSFFYNMWTPAHTPFYQEDAAALLSPALYDQFIAPCAARVAKTFPTSLVHMHSVGFLPIDEHIKAGFGAIEMHIDSGGPSAEEIYDKHKKILRQTPLLIWGKIPERDLDWIFSKLPHKGLAVNTLVEDLNTAPTITARLWQKYIGSR